MQTLFSAQHCAIGGKPERKRTHFLLVVFFFFPILSEHIFQTQSYLLCLVLLSLAVAHRHTGCHDTSSEALVFISLLIAECGSD